METAFVGRQSELELLDDLWKSQKATFLILYGRRRIGKTRLLTHWLKKEPDRGLYWVAEATSSHDQLRSFSQALYNYEMPDMPAPIDYTLANWEQAFSQVAKLAKQQRFTLIIDEVTYLMAVNPNFIGLLQRIWDQLLSKTNLMLIFSGSHMGMMQKQILAYDAPLYGRTTAHVKLSPLPFRATKPFFTEYTARDRVAVYAVWGGIPAYLERLSTRLSFLDNLRRQLQPSNLWMMDEPAFLLKDFINDPYNYVSILRALAQGSHTNGRLVTHTGMAKGHITAYLATLRDTGFVTREVPVTEDEGNSRRGRYYIVDPYLRFYYHFLAAYQAKMALGAQDEMVLAIQQQLADFIEAYTWRDLCRDWVLRASLAGVLPINVEQVGGFWQHHLDIPLVGIDSNQRHLVVGTCLWNDTPTDADPLQELSKHIHKIIPDGESGWSVYLMGFSASGWLSGVIDEVKPQVQRLSKKQGWQFAGIQLVDLETVDNNLQQWG